MYRPTYIEVDGNKLENNVKDIKKKYNDYKYFFAVVIYLTSSSFFLWIRTY